MLDLVTRRAPAIDPEEIGVGEEARIVLYRSGPWAGKVGRIPENNHEQVTNTDKAMLCRFRQHQIAYLLFPQYNLNVCGLDLNSYELFSDLVPRSAENIAHATPVGVSLRYTRFDAGSLPPAAREADQLMRAAGVFVHNGLPNVSVTPGRITFFEVESIHSPLAADYAARELRDPDSRRRAKLLITAYEFERRLYESEVEDLIESLPLRRRLLERRGLNELNGLYDAEVGRIIIPWGSRAS